MRRIALFSIIIAMFANANAVPFTNQGAFQTAAPGAVLETFDAFSGGALVGVLPSLGITFIDQADGLPGVWTYAESIGASPKSQPNNLGNRPTNAFSTQSWVFTATGGEFITAVGLWNVGTDDNMWLRFHDAGGALMEQHLIGGGPATFGGVVNPAGATTVRIDWAGAGNGFMGIDDLQVALAPASVPEPATIALLCIAGSGLRLQIRKA